MKVDTGSVSVSKYREGISGSLKTWTPPRTQTSLPPEAKSVPVVLLLFFFHS